MKLPKGHLSHSQVNAWERCQWQFKLFTIEGAKSPPDFALEMKRSTHDVILEGDLRYKLEKGANLSNIELSEQYRSTIEQKAGLLKEDPNFEGSLEKALEVEAKYFDGLLSASEPWRRKTKPIAIEEKIEVTLGGIPIEGRIDLIANEEIWDRIVDVKRMNKRPSKTPERARQLVTYSAAKGIAAVGYAALIENVRPLCEEFPGEVTEGHIARVSAQYEAAAEQISHAMETGKFIPVDTGDPQKGWPCTAQYCGAWKIGSKDWATGRDIACPFGERAVVSNIKGR
jgi:hypothetical protein